MKAVPVTLALIVGCALGMGVEWMILHPKETRETPAPEVRQGDGSLILERKPDPEAKPQHQIPAGARVERIVSVTVVPSAEVTAPISGGLQPAEANQAPAIPCPPVRVDLSLVRMPDLTRRVIASSPDGRVISGVDIPVDEPAPPRDLKWSASALAGYDFRQHCRVLGAQISRQCGPFTITSGFIGQTAFVGAGVRF